MSGVETAQRAWKLKELPRLIEKAKGFPEVVASLQQGHSATIDGAWGSSCALVAAALAERVPKTLFVVIAHISDVDDLRDDIATFTLCQVQTFPAWESLPQEHLVADEIYGQRLRLLKSLLTESPPRVVVTSIHALLQPVPSPDSIARHSRMLQLGQTIPQEELVAWLIKQGFVRRDAVELPGEVSLRGGILDVHPPDRVTPIRLEFFGDEIESIRSFDVETQRSIEQFQAISLTAAHPRTPPHTGVREEFVHLCAHAPSASWFMLVEPVDLTEQGRHYLNRLEDPRGCFSVEGTFQQVHAFPSIHLGAIVADSLETTCHLRIESIERFSGELGRVKRELDEAARLDDVLIACHNEAEAKRLSEVFADGEVYRSGRLHFDIGHVRAGFRIVREPERTTEPEVAAGPTGIVIMSDHELFHREAVRRPISPRRYEARAIDSFLDLKEGDHVVHATHGIAIYRGMELLERLGHVEEHLVLEFRDGVRVYVPASKIELVQKYVGASSAAITLSKIGSSTWQRRKERVAQAVMDLASEMIDLLAVRASQPGIAYPQDSAWQADFEASFPYEETPDQIRAAVEINGNMTRSRPMDRLICGDVGYGKTELAMRAAFKAVDFGKQVAVLVPTTVLAEQHYRTFTERMAEFPFEIEVLSRFKSKAEQREILRRLDEGKIDIIIGTHRLVQPDVAFADLGLVIIDEEQRFGVEHKERLKALRRTVDVLTLTATPIPRTLHMSLLGIRDISNLETPPRDRLAIETRIARFDPALVRNAILRELNRDGQVYFVHNRVQTIGQVAAHLQQIVPEARILVAHGQMPESELEQAMLNFVGHRADVLVATTIIESGLDIPKVNTIFLDDADWYGLADLHQLRGRVGRYKHRAYAYLVLDPKRSITPHAARRLKAIEEYSELGAGFRIAMRDLEIRGAGNILGPEQSGHIASVGYEMYCHLLENSVRTLKRQPLRSWLDVTIELSWPSYLPREYVLGLRQKIELYRKLARLRDMSELHDLRRELEDRFGEPPEPADNLLNLAELRILAGRWQVDHIRLDGNYLIFKSRKTDTLKRLARKSRRGLRLADDASAYLPIGGSEATTSELAERIKALLQ